jgi:hypothetical protein
LKSISSRRVCTVRPLSQELAPGTTSGSGISARFCRLHAAETPSLRSRSWISASLALLLPKTSSMLIGAVVRAKPTLYAIAVVRR